MISLNLIGCSLGPSAANRSHKAYIAGEYAESIRLANRALSTYEYDKEEKANLLYLKADSYAKLNRYTDAYGIIQYIFKTYPETEAFYRAKTLITSVAKHLQQKPIIKPKVKQKTVTQAI
ncbi:tol-pal system YbgF family protein [Paraglaciecola sp. L3A3]|uniref:tetratricopeptide repeat protein n=1 Tax=Paraglaciecola sp. L3A3 TaxID=2686358 RepID=UPI00131E160E|nr:hypothetical protein [Paraglaciecola sp. L3A3]